MVSIRVERLAHLGVLASVIKDFGLIHMINARLVPDAQEVITPGEAVAGMILKGLGVANRPLSLTPQFCASKPLDLLCRAGMSADMFNRFTLGRTLDEAYTEGCDFLFQELALAVGAQEGTDLRGHHLDTTSVALRGAYVAERDEQAIILLPMKAGGFGTEYIVADTGGGQPCHDGHAMRKRTRCSSSKA